MSIGNLDGVYQQLLVAPSSLKSGLLRCIDAQTERALKRPAQRHPHQINSLTDRQLIDALYAPHNPVYSAFNRARHLLSGARYPRRDGTCDCTQHRRPFLSIPASIIVLAWATMMQFSC